MGKRYAARVTLACVALALCALLGSGAGASAGARRGAAARADALVLTDFGAVGDGVTDAGPALQAALDALAAAGGGTLYVPAGRYAIVTPVSKDFGGLASPVRITGVVSATQPAPPDSGGQALTGGLDLASEFIPRTGETAAAISISGLRNLSVEELAFVGTPDVAEDALVTLSLGEVGEAVIRHCEFYGLSSSNGAIVMAWRSSLRIERSVFLGCTASSGTYSSVVQNLEWKGVSVSDTIFADYGQRPELFSKTGLGAPFSWVNLGSAAPVDNESPRREAVFRRIFFDEGGMSGLSATPDFFDPPGAPIDLVYVSTLRMNVSNLGTSGLYLSEPRGVLVEDGRFGWSHNADAAVNLLGAGSAILSRVECADDVTRVLADSTTARFVAIDAACPEIISSAAVTRVFNAATPDDDPTRYVTARFQAALGHEPDAAAHFYWADRLLRCGADASCVTSARSALGAYLASNPHPTFSIVGRATDETGAPLAGVAVNLAGSQSVSTATDADGRYHFHGLPTSGVYTVTPEKLHYAFTPLQRSVVTPAGDVTADFPGAVRGHQIVGRLSDDATRGVAGAAVTISGSRSATVTSDSNGVYSFNVPAGGNYTVTPSSLRYTFSPASQTVNDLSGDTFLAFNATPLFYAISGQVVSSTGAALGGVAVTLGGSKAATVTTNSQGFFVFNDVPRNGNYTVTPGPTVGYVFSPASRSFNNLTSDQGGVYTGTATSYRLSGRVTSGGAALPGVSVSVTGSRAATAATDSDGNYSLTLPVNGSYTVTPSKKHYTIAPASTAVGPLTSDRTADFTATLNRHKIAGRVARDDGRAMPGVAVALAGSQTGTTTTDANGDYSFTNLPAGGDYTVTPARNGYDFTPASRTYSDLGADQTAGFVVAPTSYNVTGRVAVGGAPLPGVTVTLSGARSATATTDAAGNYSLAVTSEGTYTVTPSKQHYTFAPTGQSFTDPLSNKTVDFAATLNRHSIAGRVARPDGQAMPGVAVTLSGGQTVTATTDAAGAYSFVSLPAGADYVVTPARAGYDFAPRSASFADLGADQTADFTVTPANVALAGRVTEGGAGLAGVTVTLSGARSATATTDAAGNYSLAVTSEGTYTVTPSKKHYTFAPAGLSFTDPLTDQAADFAATVDRHKITGRVMKSTDGGGLAGVTVTLSGDAAATATTDEDGNYTLAGIAGGGNYMVSALRANYAIGPFAATFDDLGADRTADFTAVPASLSLSGRVTAGGAPLSGATVVLSGTHNAMAVTGADGAYSFSVLVDGDYTITPSKRNYGFTPASAGFKALDANKTADFTGVLANLNVSGRVTAGGAALSGVTVALSGSQVATATTGADGAYSFSVPAEGDYTVTPSKRHYGFTPPSASFKPLDASKTADFAAALDRHTIRGRLTDSNNNPAAGVAFALSGSQTAAATTNANGEFSFPDLPAGGTYTVTPSSAALAFTPAAQTFNDLGADAFAAFVAALARYRVTGRLTEKGAPFAGATVELAGTHPATGQTAASVTTGADGAYSFEVLAGGDYTVTPSKKDYTFAPASAPFKGLLSDRAADFAATALPPFQFAEADFAVGEEGGSVNVTVTRTGDAAREASVVYQALGDTARGGADFLASIGLLTFAPGETTKTFSVFITDDSFVEGLENFTLTLTPGGDAAEAGVEAVASARVTIRDNDAGTAAANPLDGDEFFVRQHYRDFFSREPDAEGLAFWTGEIRKCGANAACREARRVSVSAAFFLSIEFQETGYLVYRLYKAAYGRTPERVEEFMLDARVIGEGVVVGRPGWQQRLAANRASFLRAYVERHRFATAYPASMTPAQFVDALFLSAGVTPSAAERQAAVDDFGAAPTSADLDARVFALRHVAESPALNQQEYNRAFVAMQYFGYLRRNPDQAPDTNLDGYNYWLKKLLEFGGDYERAEMVKAFLSSGEYRGRFGN
ncbi:MAG TPA: carboxypeptidase regulatory-like domain-containing protein [Pyrinomonadaceae bacterium]